MHDFYISDVDLILCQRTVPIEHLFSLPHKPDVRRVKSRLFVNHFLHFAKRVAGFDHQIDDFATDTVLDRELEVALRMVVINVIVFSNPFKGTGCF